MGCLRSPAMHNSRAPRTIPREEAGHALRQRSGQLKIRRPPAISAGALTRQPNTSILAWIIHEQPTALAHSSKTSGLAGGRAPSGCSAVCKANARPNGTGPCPTVCAPCLRGPAFYYSGSLLHKLLSNSFANCPLAAYFADCATPTSLRFFMNSPCLAWIIHEEA